MKYEKAQAMIVDFGAMIEFMAGSHNPDTCSPYGTIVSQSSGKMYTCYDVAWTGNYTTVNNVLYKTVTCHDVDPHFASTDPNATVVCGTFTIIR